jgi:hypothetical protein
MVQTPGRQGRKAVNPTPQKPASAVALRFSVNLAGLGTRRNSIHGETHHAEYLSTVSNLHKRNVDDSEEQANFSKERQPRQRKPFCQKRLKGRQFC